MTDTVPKRMTRQKYNALVIEKCSDNHIWLNKAMYIFPSDEQKIKLADAILDKLKIGSTQIPSEGITDDCESMRKLAVLTPILFLRVNWS